MNRERPLSIGEKAMVQFGNLFTLLSYGYVNSKFSEEMVRSFGVKGFMKWSQAAEATIKALSKRYGPTTTQLLIGFGAMLNGCAWCGVGHVKAANIMWFKEKGELLPFDDGAILELQRRTDSEILAKLRNDLAKEPQLLALLERQYLLKAGRATGQSEDDPFLSLASATWDWANECSIIFLDVKEVPPTAPIGKDKEACRRYEEARKAQRVANGASLN